MAMNETRAFGLQFITELPKSLKDECEKRMRGANEIKQRFIAYAIVDKGQIPNADDWVMGVHENREMFIKHANELLPTDFVIGKITDFHLWTTH